MDCCQCQGIEDLFNNESAKTNLKQYRKEGASKTTRMLLEAIKAEGVEGMSLLDIGGGVGAIQYELLKAGATFAINVDASTAYMDVAKEEAERQGYADRVSYRHGNFVELAPEIDPVDIVTLDRVICCYHDMPTLVELSSERAKKLYGVVYPRDRWWIKVGAIILNFILWLKRNPFRVFVHPTDEVEEIIQSKGLKRLFYGHTFVWQVVVYER